MRSLIVVVTLAAALAASGSPAFAGVNVERQGSESAFIEVARSTIYGSLAGLLVGGAIAWAQEGGDGTPVRWGFVVGTFAGLGFGIAQVSRRPHAAALLELGHGPVRCGGLAALEPVPGGARVFAVSLRL